MSEFRRPSPVESGEPTEPTLARDESKQAKLTRRGFLKGALGLGLAAAISPLPDFNSRSASAEVLDGGDPSVEFDDPNALVTNFAELSASGDREGMRAAAAKNIELALHTRPSVLNKMTESAGTLVDFRDGSGMVQAPTLMPGEGSPLYYISKPDDPLKFLPNLGLVQPLSVTTQGGKEANLLTMQGIYVGRTENVLSSENAGDIITHMGYFLHFAGDADTGNKLNRYVSRVFLGFTGADESKSSFLGLKVKDVDSGNQIYGTNDRQKMPVSELIASLDENVGNSVCEFDIGAATPSSPDIVEKARSLGYPAELYDIPEIDQTHLTTKEVFNAVEGITLARAELDGYELKFRNQSPTPESTAVPTQYPEVPTDKEELKDKISQLARNFPGTDVGVETGGKLAEKLTGLPDTISAEIVSHIPRLTSLTLSPTSHIITASNQLLSCCYWVLFLLVSIYAY